ncbi:hypothetical protein [Mesorhizobium sp.]|uniref:hypothetical protein n=1 Tax=Mesorhizobium sp. TaxID=1871066 RepID=UPI000FE8FCAB|nr:hypothetical protein [Mesorhizobium sp.]RWK61487.1 MAG: hypothetical protein EOR49_16690 [Mesorhizobium sp.]RWM43892.1 MAG: hypothetical protein EOR76_27430 [Mesorhizobium sp.]RWM53431.1 MAG: hypothetical protein EOR78_19410 [Mesorhizobium sp.]RWM56826.1 MAG: hypothetical protein EOR79_17300 [Mesorhizobium sp.]RWM96462.1 MAG: hypothetical protein EOR85_22695 [Mesorhizobium sp.]
MKLSRRYLFLGASLALGLLALGSKSTQAAEITEAEGRVIAKEAYTWLSDGWITTASFTPIS